MYVVAEPTVEEHQLEPHNVSKEKKFKKERQNVVNNTGKIKQTTIHSNYNTYSNNIINKFCIFYILFYRIAKTKQE